MKELLKKIGILEAGYFTKDEEYVIDFEDSNEFNKAFSKLEKCDEVEEMEESSVINLQASNVMYISKDETTLLNLIADFDSDIYKLVISEVGEEDSEEDK